MKEVRKFIIFYGDKPFMLPKFEWYGGYKRFEYQKLEEAKKVLKEIMSGERKRCWFARSESEQKELHDKFWANIDNSKFKIAEHGIVREYFAKDLFEVQDGAED